MNRSVALFAAFVALANAQFGTPFLGNKGNFNAPPNFGPNCNINGVTGCASNFETGFLLIVTLTLLMTSLLVVLHFCAWRKYKRVKARDAQVKLVKDGEETSSRRARAKKPIDPSVFYSNYGAPLNAYGANQ